MTSTAKTHTGKRKPLPVVQWLTGAALTAGVGVSMLGASGAAHADTTDSGAAGADSSASQGRDAGAAKHAPSVRSRLPKLNNALTDPPVSAGAEVNVPVIPRPIAPGVVLTKPEPVVKPIPRPAPRPRPVVDAPEEISTAVTDALEGTGGVKPVKPVETAPLYVDPVQGPIYP